MATYFFASDGAEGNSGLSAAAPKQLLSTAATRINAGDTVLFGTGSIYTPVTNNAMMFDPLFTNAGQYIGTFDHTLGAEKPILDSLYYDDGTGWSDAGSGRWQKTFTLGTGAGDVAIAFDLRAWAGMTGPTSARSRNPFRFMGSAAACVAELQWFHSAGVVTVYTGTANNPFLHYGGISWVRRIAGSVFISTRFRNMFGNRIDDGIIFRGGSSLFQNGTGATWTGVEAQCCPNGPGIQLTSSATDIVSNTRLLNTVVDYYTAASENNGSSSNWGGQDGIKAITAFTGTGGVRGIEIIDPLVRGARHSGIGFQSPTGVFGSNSGIVIRGTAPGRAVINCGDGIDYGRAVAFNADGWAVIGVDVTGQCTQSQVNGGGIWRGGSFKQNRRASSDVDNSGTDNCIAVSSPNATAQPRTAVTIEGVLFENPWNYAIITGDASGLPTTTNSGFIQIQGCTFVMLENYNAKLTIQMPTTAQSLPGAAILAYAPTAFNGPYFPFVRQNAFLLPVGETCTVLHCSADYPTSPASAHFGASTWDWTQFTANQVTGYAVGKQADNQVFNTTSAAGMNSSYVPSTSSALYRAGTHIGYRLDGAGAQRWNPPSVGAYEA
jgi:hypothetical protein